MDVFETFSDMLHRATASPPMPELISYVKYVASCVVKATLCYDLFWRRIMFLIWLLFVLLIWPLLFWRALPSLIMFRATTVLTENIWSKNNRVQLRNIALRQRRNKTSHMIIARAVLNIQKIIDESKHLVACFLAGKFQGWKWRLPNHDDCYCWAWPMYLIMK